VTTPHDRFDWLERFPWPAADAHKHARGRLGVVCGPLQTGAARLAARAGLRIGAGVVTVLCPPEALALVAPALTAVMVRPVAGAVDLAQACAAMQAVVVGPGAGLTAQTRQAVEALAALPASLVIDADGLTVFQNHPGSLFALLTADDVMTPHEGEFERLFPRLLAAQGREAAAAEAAGRAGCIVLLKGPATVIAAPDGRLAANPNGSPWLATAGTGDVLAGMIGGLLAQGMEAFDASCAAAWIHAEAGRGFGPGLIAEDLPERTPDILRALRGE
jgi:hydroxyethylthiazole kinase-like uncharacterized protein yjeF